MVNKRNETCMEQAYSYIRTQIFNMVFRPGDFISDIQITKTLNISRTPVREAIQRLEKEKLLINQGRKGWQVYQLEIKDIEEIFDLTIAIQCMIITKAASCYDENLQQNLITTLENMKKDVEESDATKYLDDDEKLHNTLVLMSGNTRAGEILNNLDAQWHRIRIGIYSIMLYSTSGITEHEAFVHSVLNHEGEQASEQMKAHLIKVRDNLIHVATQLIMPFSPNGF